MKKHLSKRILALLLTLVMVLSLVPMTFAEEPAAEEFTLATTLSAGDKVVIYHPASGKAMSTTLRNTYYREGVDVTVADGTITDPDAALIWTVEEAEGGFKLLDAEGHKLSMQGTYNSIPNDQAHDVWALREGAAENTVNITNVLAPAGSQGDPKAIEYYNNQFTGYYLGSGDAFVLQLYVLQDGEPVDPPAEDLTGKTVILHTNDTHGALLGFAQVAKVKAEYEAKGAQVLLVDAGDYSQGTTYVSTSKGETAITVMNAAGYDLATLGNHEFDFGYEKLAENFTKAEFQVLCANVIKDGASLFTAHTVKEVGGVKLGFFGLETAETATKVNPGMIQGISFLGGEEMYACAQGEIDALKAEGADLVIGLVHLGVDDESAVLGNRSIDLYANVSGVDFLIDGHSHTVMTEGPSGEPIQSTGTKASATAFANVGLIVIDNATKKIERNELIPLGEDAPVDETVAAVAQGIMDEVDAQYGAVFATSEVELCGVNSPGNRTQETNNGDLITDAILWSVLRGGSIDVPDENVVAITNGGGIRAPIHVGDVTMNDIHTVLPFGNTVAVVYVSGEELLEALEASTFCTPTAIGGFPQVAGMKFTIDTTKEYDQGELYIKADGNPTTYYGPASIQRVTINEIGGKPFDPAATYAVVTNNFCAAGGDTYNVFMKAANQFDTNIPMDEAVMDYIVEELDGVISAAKYENPQGRIIVKTDAMADKTVILHTNDTHGALLGFAQVAKVKADYENQGATVLLVDAGDYSQGTTYVSASKGETAITVMNAAGYDFATLGNHEFDFGYEKLAENLTKAEFQVLCANVIKDGASLFTAHAIKEVDGVKLGFFGLETAETATKVNPGMIVGINFLGGEEMYACAQGEIDALKAEGADVVIGLVHLGVDEESAALGNRSVDLYAHITGADFLIDGHSHTVMTEGPSGEPIQSTGTKASDTTFANVGLIVIDNETKKIERNELIPLGEDAPVDETVAAVAQGIMDEVDAQYGAVFATSEVDLNGDKAPGNRTEETNMGDLITDAMLWSVLRAGSIDVPDENVVAITNGGGIRAPIAKGDVTMNDVHTVLPFGNTVAVVYVSGEELLEALEASTFCTPTAVGGFPQVAGMKFSVNTDREFVPGELYIKADGNPTTYYAPDHIRRVTINEIGGKPFDPKATYAVVTNNFCAAGGDTYNVFMKAANQFDTNIPMDEAVMDYIVEVLGGVIPASQYAEPQGRIRIGPFRFTDVTKPSKYYYTPVYWAYNHDPQIVAGTGDGTTFSPNKACTRAEIVTFLYAAAGRPEISTTENPFTDVKKKDWFYQAAVWAKEAGITGGTGDGKFQPNKVCTRAEVVTFLYAWAGRPEIETVENPFTDVKKKDYFYTPVLWAVENGITGGTGDGTTFEPKKACTRGEIVTFLYAAMRSEFEFLVTSDLHGQIYATDYTVPYEQSGTYKRGLTRIATYIKEQKAKFGSNVYTVDMGDTFQGAPLTYYYAFNKPEEKDPAILAFRTIGYDMWVVGNHEFNYGLEILNRQMAYAVSESTDTEQQLQICLANYLDAANNSDESKDWSTWKGYEPYVIKKFGSYKVAVIGFGNPNIPKWDVPANWEGIYFANILETYQHYEAEMLEKADMIVVVAHSGIGSDEGSDFMERLVNATNTIAFAFSGHEHGNQVYMAKNADGKDIPILQPYTKARAIAQVHVVADNGEVTVTPQIVNMENYPVDEELAELLKPYETETWENYMLQPIGKALGDYPAANLGTAPSAFMDLINTVQTWGAYDRTGENTPDKAEDDKPAMLSISAPLTSGSKENLIPAGDIYLGDMFGLYRFENWFYQITMSGEEVHQWLEFAATKVHIDEAGNPYVTNGDLTYYDVIMGEGFHYDIDAARPEGERVVNMTYNGEKVAADDEFTVVVNNYRYNGGGNYVNWLNTHGCEFIANDPDRVIYSTQFDMIQGEDEGQARALLVSYIKEQTQENGGITPFIISDWTVQNGIEDPVDPGDGDCYVKVTEAPADWSGTYIIVYTENGTDAYVFNGSANTNGYVSATIEDGKIAADEEMAQVVVEAMEGGYSLKVGAQYMDAKQGTNGLYFSEDPVLNTLALDEDGDAVITCKTMILRFNNSSDQLRFRYFKPTSSMTTKVQLYKLNEG